MGWDFCWIQEIEQPAQTISADEEADSECVLSGMRIICSVLVLEVQMIAGCSVYTVLLYKNL